jgi:hypothetical protein
MCVLKHKKFMTKNSPSKIKILYNYNTFKYMVNLYFYFLFETPFHWIITKYITCFYISSYMHIIFIWYLHNCKKSYKLIQIMIYEKKRNKKRYWISCIILKWLHHGSFQMLNAKIIFSFSPFALTFALLLTILWTMSTYPHNA